MSFRTNRLNHQQIINNLKSTQYSQSNYGSSFNYKDKPTTSFIDSSSYLMKEEVLNRISDKVDSTKSSLCIFNGNKIYLNEVYENVLTVPFDGSEYTLSQIFLTTKSANNLLLNLTDKNNNTICEHVIKPDTTITKLDNFTNLLKELNVINFNIKEQKSTNEEYATDVLDVSDVEDEYSFKTSILSVNVVLSSN
jgi:hypothetical protein